MGHSGVGDGQTGHRANEVGTDLEPLAEWCGEVLARSLADDSPGALPAAATLPPLPAHLREPLNHHGFDAFDQTVVALALAPDLDPVLTSATAALTGSPGPRYPTAALIARLVGAAGAERTALGARLSDAGPLAQIGLIQIVPPVDTPVCGDPPRTPTMLASCVATTALLRWTFGVTRLESDLHPLVRDDLPVPAAPGDPAMGRALVARLSDAVPSLTSLVGDRPATLLATALHAIAACGLPYLVVDAAALVPRPAAARVAAEAMLREAVVVVTGDLDGVPPARWETLAWTICVGAHPASVDDGLRDVRSLVAAGHRRGPGGHNLIAEMRRRGVRVANAEAERMERWEHLSVDEVGTLADTLTARTPAAGEPGALSADDVTAVSVSIVGRDLAQLATPLQTSRDWDRLVLPPALRQELAELVDQAAHRAYVLDTVGFGELPGQPRGVTAVFAGPSGTGKTLAARLVAGELGLPLYRVDLARVISKYIGETERNLDAVFTAAGQADAVLLFDEAEALFGKRSEVQDARDRYANMEISYLLQRMEDHEGVTLLATNLIGHLDDAFARRLSFCLHFPFPDTEQRERIWRAVWPDRVEFADDLDLAAVAAAHRFSGGHIRNVALAAAHLARGRGGPVDSGCLSRAVVREYAKLGVDIELTPDVGA